MGISCALVPMASRSCLWARKAFEVPVKALPRFAAVALTTYSCQRKLWRRRGPKADTARPGAAAQPLDFSPEFCFRPGIQDVETELAQFFQTGSSLEFVKDGKRIEFPHGCLGPKAVEGEMELAVLDR